MNKELIKKILPYGIAIIIFIFFAIIYCSPMLDGKVIQSGDMTSFKGMVQEGRQYHEETSEYTFWTGSMFSGMPNFQIGGGNIPSYQALLPLKNSLSLFFPDTMLYIIIYLIGFFILLRSFGVNKWLCIVGAIGITLSSYFFIIIEAGHNTKAFSIGLMASVIAGYYLIFKGKYLWGILLTLIYSPFAITGHPQMAYYFMMLIGCLIVAELYIHIKDKKIGKFFIALALFGVSLGVGIGARYTKVRLDSEFVKETMRGGHSELIKETDNLHKTSGLDLDYATQWSYGIDETMTLLIPNFKGASSHYDVGTNSKVYEELTRNGVSRKNSEDFCKNVPTYWGDQPFTSGPVYVGAIIFFLFILGLMIVKDPYKWALLAATIFSVLLSWGHNFMPLTKLFFDYFPLYDKFRAVSSILVVAEITIPLLGFLAIKTIMNKAITKEKLIKNIYISAGVTAGICLFFTLFGGFIYDFTSFNDAQTFSQFPQWLGDAIVAERVSMFRSDAFRSCVFILLGFSILWLFAQGKIKFFYFIVGLGALILVDMWTVNKRFFNNDNFVLPESEMAYFAKQPYEEYILQDKDPHFRVLNLTSNTFNEARTSYYLKSIGGYNAAKLRRYQDLISEHIAKMNIDVINMLNTKYFIVPGQNNQPVVQLNPDAMGNAWFVDSILVANSPNEESDALNIMNIRNTAVLNVKFVDFVKDFKSGHDSTARIEFLSYAPNKIEYKTFANEDGVVVFSEIYYPYGWKAFIDDQPVEHFRANYTLRALNIPKGEHHIRFIFDPDTFCKSEPVSWLCISIIYGTIIGTIVYTFIRRRKEKKPA